jgi:hypothetical protein
MANKSKKKSTKSEKLMKGSVKANKYSKLMLVASKELAEKKKALAKAEKALATAQKTHTELLAEVARLDMVERSLKALVDGTPPPQNVRYVYSYPQWVWQGGIGWYWNGGTWTTTPQYTTYGNAQGGLTLGNVQGGIQQLSNNNVAVYNSPGTVTTCEALPNCVTTSDAFNSGGNRVLQTVRSSGECIAVTDPWLTIDLSSGATYEDTTTLPEKAETEGSEFQVAAGNG